MPKPQKAKTSLAELLARHPDPPRNDWANGRPGASANEGINDDGFPRYNPKDFETDNDDGDECGSGAGGALALLAALDKNDDWIPVKSSKQKKKSPLLAAPPPTAPSAAPQRATLTPSSTVRPTGPIPAIPLPLVAGIVNAASRASAGPSRAPYSVAPGAAAVARTPRPQTHDAEGRPISGTYYQTFQKVYRDPSGSVCMRFHKTDIVTVQPNGDVGLTSGGFRTRTTYLSVEEALKPLGLTLHSSLGGEGRGDWSVGCPDGSHIPWEDEMVLPATSEADRMRGQRLLTAYNMALPPAAIGAAAARTYVPAPVSASPPAATATAPAPAPMPVPVPVPAPAPTPMPTWSYRFSAGIGTAPTYAPHLRPPMAVGAASTAAGRSPAPAPEPTLRSAESLSELQEVLNAALAIKDETEGRGRSNAGGAVFPIVSSDGDADLDDELACIACMATLRATVLIPCGHMIMCAKCAAEVLARSGVCPLCREMVLDHATINT